MSRIRRPLSRFQPRTALPAGRLGLSLMRERLGSIQRVNRYERRELAILRAQKDAMRDGILVIASSGRIISWNRRFLELWNLEENEVRNGTDDDFFGWVSRRALTESEFAEEISQLGFTGDDDQISYLIALKDGRTISTLTTPVRSRDGSIEATAWHFRETTESRRSELLQSALFRIAEVTRSASNLQELYALIHGIVGELMDATNFFIAILDESRERIIFPYFVDHFDAHAPAMASDQGLTGYVLRTGEALLATPETFDSLFERGLVNQVGSDSVDWLGVPLSSGSRVYGVLGVQSYSTAIRYGETDKDILLFVSQHVSSAIEHKQKEDALRESETRYRQMFENNRAIKLLIDPQDGSILDANIAACEFYGYSRADLGSMSIGEINVLTPDELRAELADAASQQKSYFRFRHRLKSGEIRDVEVHSGPIDVRGRPILYSIVHDVTERRRYEETMRTQAAAMQASIDGIAILDSDGNFTYVNEAFVRLYSYPSAADLIGRSWTHVHGSGEVRRFLRDIRPRLINDGRWRGHASGKAVNGNLFPEEISLTLIENGGTICVARDVTERTHAEEQIRHLAYHDALTGLPNRLLFKDRLSVAIARAQRDGTHLAVLFLDLDRFKIINDSLGHSSGDELLQSVAARVLRCMRESDTVARLGGDEFTILVTNLVDTHHATRIAQNLLAAVRQPFILGGRELFVTTSIGISLFPDDGADAESLIKGADTAMYQAKGGGRDKYEIANDTISSRARERLSLENGLRRAITNEEFVLHYQPIYDFRTGRIHGMEALIRWQHPDNGLISPAVFIPLAETTGLMIPIGAWTLHAATMQARAWHEAGFRDLTLAVNISVTQLQHPDLVDTVRSALSASGLRPSLLELEITESSAMENPDLTIDTLDRLKSLGIRISLDDFGIGYSSLGHLKRLPIDTLKIDQSFVRDTTTDSDTASIVAAIIAMGHKLRLDVIAEGVETESQRVFLQEHLCDRMQGFLLCKPLGAADFEQLLLSHNQHFQQWQLVAS